MKTWTRMLKRWFRTECNRISPRLQRRRRLRSLALESLEDRTVPSTVTWINPSGGDWDTPTNWSTGQVPGAGDDAVINYLGITITHDQGISDSVYSIQSQAAIEISGGSLTFAGPSEIDNTLTLGDATFGGTGNPTVSGLFTLDW